MSIEKELVLQSKIDRILAMFVKQEIVKNQNIKYSLSYTVNKGVIKIETDNKLVAQEIALRIRQIEERLRKDKAEFKKLLI